MRRSLKENTNNYAKSVDLSVESVAAADVPTLTLLYSTSASASGPVYCVTALVYSTTDLLACLCRNKNESCSSGDTHADHHEISTDVDPQNTFVVAFQHIRGTHPL